MVIFRVVMLSLVMFIGVAASCNKNKSAPEGEQVDEIVESSSYLNDYSSDTEYPSEAETMVDSNESDELETLESEGNDPE